MPKSQLQSQCFAYWAQNSSFWAKLPGRICAFCDHRGQVWSGQRSWESDLEWQWLETIL